MPSNSLPIVAEQTGAGPTIAGTPGSPASTSTAPGTGRRAPALPLRKKIVFALFAVLAPVVFLAALGEIGGRVYVHFRYGVPGKSYGIYMPDEELGATHRPNSYNTNSVINNFGFRNLEDITEEKQPGVTRVYCSGGSTTFCYNLTTEESWPNLLQEKLRAVKGHERDEVLNAGQITFGVSQELALARRLVPRLKPDIVVLFTGINELLAANIIAQQDGQSLDELLAEERWGVCPKSPDQARFFKRHSVLVKLLDYKIKKYFESRATSAYHESEMPQGAVHPWVNANFEHTLREYLAFLRSNGCKVIVMHFGDNGKEDWYLRKCIRVLRDRAVEIGKEQDATICDLVPAVDRDPRRPNLFITTGIHVTREGAELYADLLSKTVLEISTEKSTAESSAAN
jgi:lysophospholipase L1-like esterase